MRQCTACSPRRFLLGFLQINKKCCIVTYLNYAFRECVALRDEGRTKEQLIDELSELRNQVARLTESEATRLSMENEAIARIGRIITSSLDIDTIYERFAGEVSGLIPLDGISITLIDHKEACVRIVYLSGVVIPGRTKGNSCPSGRLTDRKNLSIPDRD